MIGAMVAIVAIVVYGFGIRVSKVVIGKWYEERNKSMRLLEFYNVLRL